MDHSKTDFDIIVKQKIIAMAWIRFRSADSWPGNITFNLDTVYEMAAIKVTLEQM